jgi:hypothetical protein
MVHGVVIMPVLAWLLWAVNNVGVTANIAAKNIDFIR